VIEFLKIEKFCDLAVINEEDYTKYGNLVHFNFHGKLIEKEKNITDIAE